MDNTLFTGGDTARPTIIAGPCVLESEEIALDIARVLKEQCEAAGLPLIFKGSFDKANRTSVDSFRGPGLDAGLAILAAVKRELALPVLSDIHEAAQAAPAARVLDVLQIPAFLCRQTDLLVAAGETGRPVNIKKGQFLAPEDMKHALDKVYSTGNKAVSLTERGASFGYHNLVVDFRSLAIMRGLGAPVVFDATHSVQMPSGEGGKSGGRPEFILPLLKAACAVGVDGVFMEVYPDPAQAKSDGANSLPLAEVPKYLEAIKRICAAAEPSAK